ncbi:MAG: thrombospondin type 3 repeat-containing protein [Bacteroidota bacterium]|nr:thrombospondin type 3 repeat-containing protein [Bacteroidota bacterium]
MKKLLLLSMILAFTASLNAQTVDKKWGIGGGFGAYGTLNNGGLGLMPELYLSRYLSPKLDFILKTEMGVYRSGLNSNLDLVNPFLNLRYKLSDETKKLRPYLFAGPGFLADNSETGLNFDLGVGGKYYVKPNTALYLEAGYINGIKTTSKGLTERENIWKVTAGIELGFGKAKDSDMDGVSDNKDKCPDTPTGVAVDVNGCPVDTDGDGVADYIDDCPTVAGLTSLKGCPDSDKDGIADKDDACPEIAGLVSLKGCPDSDGDGVADKDDKCPDTPKGWKVDASGCPFDTDKDGVIDEEDNCPTVAGPKENKGCPIVEKTVEKAVAPEMMIEPVYFDYDKSNVRVVEKAKINKLVNLLKTNNEYKVILSGFADNKGTEEYNLKLSERRINSVVNAIKSGGVKATRVSKENPLGEANPAATNDTEEGRALNRRVEFEVIKTK